MDAYVLTLHYADGSTQKYVAYTEREKAESRLTNLKLKISQGWYKESLNNVTMDFEDVDSKLVIQ